tara:strand:- start:1629 stop:2462 length:834 start_codon:yes stop_codon:yes gene_type:complete
MIIWLASYPKSGNTWIRLFINSLLFTPNNTIDINKIRIEQFPSRKYFFEITNNVDDVSEFMKNCNKAQSKLNLDKKLKFFKTHNAFWRFGAYSFTDTFNTLGIIHIVRDPRNVITSIKNHYNYESYDMALKFIKDEKNMIGVKGSEKEMDLPTLISSWKVHFNSWRNLTKLKKNYLLIKYEDLIKNPFNEFLKITNFISKISKLKFDEKNILNSVKNTNFETLKKQEELKGFKEAPNNSNKFFNLGPDNNWQKLLDTQIKEDIEKNFQKEMTELGYL